MCVLTHPSFLPGSLCSGLTVCLIFFAAHNLNITIII